MRSLARLPDSTSWVKGQSGNQGGRPAVLKPIRDLARQHTETAIATLVDIMNDVEAPAMARVAAAVSILDRGWGRPGQQPPEVPHTGKELKVQMQWSDSAAP